MEITVYGYIKKLQDRHKFIIRITHLLLLLESQVLSSVLQGRSHGSLQRFLILQLLLLQSRLDVDLLPHPLLCQLTVQLVDAPVGVSDQRVQIICAQLSRWERAQSSITGRMTGVETSLWCTMTAAAYYFNMWKL